MSDRSPLRRQGIRRGLLGLSLLVMLGGVISLGWAFWPYSVDGVQMRVLAGVLPAAPEGSGFASLSDYTLAVSWPRWLRLGDSGTISIALSSPSEQVGAALVDAIQVVMVEVDISRLPLAPSGLTQHNMAPGTDLQTSRIVTAVQTGEFPGKALVSFGFFDEEMNELVPVPVAVVDFEIDVRSLWGLEHGIVIWLGFVGLVLGGVMFLLQRYVQVK
jgi:hypothetical protein